jgi:hypothetical protein
MQRKILTLFILSIAATACTKKATVITPLADISTISPQGMVYTLPLTTFHVRVESVHYQSIPGPYAQFAERFMGIANAPQKPKSEWSIAAVDVVSDIEADMETLFAVEPGDNFQSDFFQLAAIGLVIPLNGIEFSGSQEIGVKTNLTNAPISFTDLSSTPFIAAERTTHYSRVFQDSTFVKVPVHKTVIVEKSIEDKAREAAEFIFSLRKRRFELIAGDADFVAEGKAVEAVLNEINKLEDDYLSLFIGKHIESKTIHWFDYTPKPNGDATSILFRFSLTKGVVPASDLSASPVLISTTSDQNWKSVEILNQLSSEKGLPRTDALYYRIPIPTSIKISFGNTEIFSRRMSIYQFGPMVRIPSNFLIRGNNPIHFYPSDKK